MAIKRYKRLQTGPKIQFGGVQKGFSKRGYQSRIEENVKKLPQSSIAITIVKKRKKTLFYFLKSSKNLLSSSLNLFYRANRQKLPEKAEKIVSDIDSRLKC